MDEASSADYTNGYDAFSTGPGYPHARGREGDELVATRGVAPAIAAALTMFAAGALGAPACVAAAAQP